MFGASNIVRNSDKNQWMSIGYGIAFVGGDWWRFNNDTARNVIIFGADNSSSSYVDNLKNKFLILGLAPTFGINGSFDESEKKFTINFTKVNTKFSLTLHYIGGNSYMFINAKEIIKFKVDNKNVNFPTLFCLGSISDGFNATEFREICKIF